MAQTWRYFVCREQLLLTARYIGRPVFELIREALLRPRIPESLTKCYRKLYLQPNVQRSIVSILEF